VKVLPEFVEYHVLPLRVEAAILVPERQTKQLLMQRSSRGFIEDAGSIAVIAHRDTYPSSTRARRRKGVA
jgi:hypothetical protein